MTGQPIKQGHPYMHHQRKVICLREFPCVVGYVCKATGWFSMIRKVNPANLKPLPLRYLGGNE